MPAGKFFARLDVEHNSPFSDGAWFVSIRPPDRKFPALYCVIHDDYGIKARVDIVFGRVSGFASEVVASNRAVNHPAGSPVTIS